MCKLRGRDALPADRLATLIKRVETEPRVEPYDLEEALALGMAKWHPSRSSEAELYNNRRGCGLGSSCNSCALCTMFREDACTGCPLDLQERYNCDTTSHPYNEWSNADAGTKAERYYADRIYELIFDAWVVCDNV